MAIQALLIKPLPIAASGLRREETEKPRFTRNYHLNTLAA
jgi:hypothetical protein